jgi:saccharopine dehydrogenase-like NADP-dependent oxidoreductase|tara:strand:+ start:1392 stop:2516 length:1125 start_codon:yes stop_codon:yes gene_type:complete
MRAVICGVGRMGTAIAWAMDKLGYHVTGMDTNPEAANNIPRSLDRGVIPNNEFLIVDDADDIIRGLAAQVKPDIVISSLPYHQTEKVGHWCVENGVRYCDLGGRVDVSESINNLAKEKATKPVFTDLGLAPGWVNILAEEGYKSLRGGGQITNIDMMVGGLPHYDLSVQNPLRYCVSWSTDGLINEYKDDCIILENGQIKTVKGMDGLEDVESSKLGKLEAFYTSGGASHSIHSMKKRGVNNCSYKTLRYKGHGSMIKFLIRDCQLDDQTLNKIFLEGCGHCEKDEVIIMATVERGSKVWREEKLVRSDDRFSAMQKATAFSISSVASIMGEGYFDNRTVQNRGGDMKSPLVLAYADVPHEEFNRRLETLGVYK